MAGSEFDLTGSRIQNATRVNQAVEDADVTAWPKANDFIVCAMVEALGHSGGSSNLTLRWRNVTDSGSFTNLGASGELTWSGTTDLVNGNAVSSGEEVCTPISGTTLVDGVEREGANVVSTTISQNEYIEHQWAVDASGALDGKQYEFEINDSTAGALVGTCLADITTSTGATEYSLVCAGASYPYTATAANLEYHSALDVVGASYPYSAVAANLEFHSKLVVAGASYPYSAAAATLSHLNAWHTFDTKSVFNGISDPLTSSYTCGVGATVFVLGIVTESTNRAGGAPTYDGNTLLQVPSSPQNSATVDAELWYMFDPPTGSAKQISIPNSGTIGVRGIASSWISSTGASALDIDAGGTGSTAIASQAITPTVDGAAVIDICGTQHNDVPSANSQTILFSVDSFSVSHNAQYNLQEVAAELTFSWTQDGADDWAIVVAAFKPVIAYALTAAGASYAYAVVAANLEYHSAITAGAASYPYSASAVTLDLDYNLIVDTVNYSWAGAAVNLEYHSAIVADSASYPWAGATVELLLSLIMAAEAVNYPWGATAAGFILDSLVKADTVNYSWAASAATLEYHQIMAAAGVSYSWAGAAANLEYHTVISAEAASYAYSAIAANLEYHSLLVAATTNYPYTASAATLTYAVGLTIVAGSASYAYAAASADFLRDYVMVAAAASYPYNASASTLTYIVPGVGGNTYKPTYRPRRRS